MPALVDYDLRIHYGYEDHHTRNPVYHEHPEPVSRHPFREEYPERGYDDDARYHHRGYYDPESDADGIALEPSHEAAQRAARCSLGRGALECDLRLGNTLLRYLGGLRLCGRYIPSGLFLCGRGNSGVAFAAAGRICHFFIHNVKFS